MWQVALGIGVIGACLLLPSRIARAGRSMSMYPSHASVKIFRRHHPAHHPGVVIHHKHAKKHVHAYDQYGNYHRR